MVVTCLPLVGLNNKTSHMTHSMLFVSVILVQVRKAPDKIISVWESQYGRGWSPGLLQGIHDNLLELLFGITM